MMRLFQVQSLVRSVNSAQDILQQNEECHDHAHNYSSRKCAAEDGLASVINDGIVGLTQSSFENIVESSKKRKTKKEWEMRGQKSLELVTSHFLKLLRFPDEKMKGIISSHNQNTSIQLTRLNVELILFITARVQYVSWHQNLSEQVD